VNRSRVRTKKVVLKMIPSRVLKVELETKILTQKSLDRNFFFIKISLSCWRRKWSVEPTIRFLKTTINANYRRYGGFFRVRGRPGLKIWSLLIEGTAVFSLQKNELTERGTENGNPNGITNAANGRISLFFVCSHQANWRFLKKTENSDLAVYTRGLLIPHPGAGKKHLFLIKPPNDWLQK